MKYFILIVLIISNSYSKPLVFTNYKYYDIYPTNKHNLEESMDYSSPLRSFGSIRHGTVSWKIAYKYKRERKNNICKISETKTKVYIEYYVPKIAKIHKLEKGTTRAFNRYYIILKDYLKKYSDFSVQAAKEIESELLEIKAISNCDKLKTNAKKLASNIIKKYKKKNKDYEIRTYEGFLEGIRKEKLF